MSRLRSDLSCTVFVNDPSTYEGGELSIEIGNLAIPFKGAAGEAIVYPSTTLHEVVPVRSGQRLVSITFIESYIADEHQRTQVYELNEIAALEGTHDEVGKPRAPRRRAAEPDAHVVDDLDGRGRDSATRLRIARGARASPCPCGSRRDCRGASRAGSPRGPPACTHIRAPSNSA